MNYSQEDFLSVEEILADVIATCDDADFRVMSKGFYTSHIQQALEKLSFDTFFSIRNPDFKVPEDLRLPIPKGAFNIKQMYLFNGTKCDVVNAQNVWHKRNYINGGNGILARNTGRNQSDPFYGRRFDRHHDRVIRPHSDITNGSGDPSINNLFFYGIQNGLIMLSPSCKKFERIMVVFNGIHTEIGDIPLIPTFLREAVRDHVTVLGLTMRMVSSDPGAEYNKWFQLRQLFDKQLNDEFNGSWIGAERRVKALDSKRREDLKEYLSKLDI